MATFEGIRIQHLHDPDPIVHYGSEDVRINAVVARGLTITGKTDIKNSANANIYGTSRLSSINSGARTLYRRFQNRSAIDAAMDFPGHIKWGRHRRQMRTGNKLYGVLRDVYGDMQPG